MASQAGKRQRPTARYIALLALILAAGLLAPYILHQERRSLMPTIDTPEGLLAGIPPIDRAAAKKTETATFGLG